MQLQDIICKTFEMSFKKNLGGLATSPELQLATSAARPVEGLSR
eukprot:COSAG06_NODE_1864_length_8194_cov_4.258431_10_plen_44_part_00